MSKLSFHVRHEVTPERAWDVLTALAEGYSSDHIIQADRQLSRLRQLGLVEETSISLSPMGLSLYKLGDTKRSIINEFFHFLHFTSWKPTKVQENTPFWSYRKYCEMLYERRSCTLDSATRDAFTAEMNNAIYNAFGDQCYKKGALSLSTNSLSGIEHWLKALNPPAIEGNAFVLRQFCSPELLILAVGYMVQETAMDLDVDLLLSPEKRIFIQKLCLVENDRLDRIFDWTFDVYPNLIKPGTRTGSYGRFIRLLKLPTFDHFVL